jgi:hypothetical protein
MNKKVMFYGAGDYAEISHKFALKNIGLREPLGFCDRDPNKQGKLFLGLPVMTFADAKVRFGEFDVYVTANWRNAPSIIAFLMKNGVSPENIINYEPVEERLGCFPLDSVMSIFFSDHHMKFLYCCYTFDYELLKQRPWMDLPDNQLDKAIFSKVMSDKMSFSEKIKTGFPPLPCKNCWRNIKSAYRYVNTKKLRQIEMGGFAPCNFSCHNCGNVQMYKKCTYSPWDIFLDRFGVIVDSGLVAEDCLIMLSLGEYSVVKKHGAILKHLSKYPLILFGNAYKWSDPTAEALENGNTWLRVSVDAGNRETFARIKGVDGWDKVCGNLERYAKLGTIVLKYIIFPGQNDDDANFKGFYELADRLGVKVNLSRDFSYDGDLSGEILEKAAEFIIHFQNSGKLWSVELRPGERERLQTLLQSKGVLKLTKLESLAI